MAAAFALGHLPSGIDRSYLEMLAALLSRVATTIKGREYIIDSQLGSAYLLRIGFDRATMKLRGAIRFPAHHAKPAVGRGVGLHSKSKMCFDRGVTLDDQSYVDATSTQGVRFGRNATLGKFSRIECTGSLSNIGHGISVGNDVGLGTNNFFGAAGGITIGDNTIIGNFVSFHSENHVIDDLERPIREQGVTRQGISVGAGCWLGAKVTILDGVVIEDDCVVAAGSVLTAGRYEACSIYGGVPAKMLKKRGA